MAFGIFVEPFYLCGMNISAVNIKGRFSYYGLYDSVRDSAGKVHRIYRLYLGTLSRFSSEKISELAKIVTTMVETGESVICEDKMLYDKALDIYSKYIEKFGNHNATDNLSKQAVKNSKKVQSEYVIVKLDSLVQKEVRFIYPYSEHLTAKYLRENSAICSNWRRKSCFSTSQTPILKADTPYHKGDNGIKAHLNLAVLAYWVVSVTKHRLKLKGNSVRWSEIMRIASTQSVVTAEFETVERGVIQVRQNTFAEEKLLEIYTLLGVNPNPLGSRKSVVHKIPSSKKNDTDSQVVT